MKQLVQTLINNRLITEEQFKEAKIKQIGAKKPIHELFVEMGFLSEEDLMKVASEVSNMPITDLNNEEINPSAVKLISYEIAKRYGVLPLRKDGNVLVIASTNPADSVTLDNIRIITRMEVKSILSTKSQISEGIEKYYQADGIIYDLLKNAVEEKIDILFQKDNLSIEKRFNIEAIKDKHGAIPKLLNFILSDAVRARASDIHIEPHKDSVVIRYRIDGGLKDIIQLPLKLHQYIVTRIKIISDLDITETKKMQEGRTSISTLKGIIDIRISVLPTHFGEKVASRILDPMQAKVQIDRLGFSDDELKLFKKACSIPHGMILATGPTGSGKTSTLYAALNYIKDESKNIVTIEDPVEYTIEGVNQTQINPVKDVTFVNSLKTILRQDPDIILVGEIRDKETAEAAFRAALTGHLVFSTLHTNNSVSTITRLFDIGLEPYLIASSVSTIVAQRLAKQNCPHCKEEYTPDKEILEKFKIYIDLFKIDKFYRGKGCYKCNFVGFLDRVGIFEILMIDEKIRELIFKKVSEDEILKEARKSGLKLLIESGMEKVKEGITTLEEVASIIKIADKIKVPEMELEKRSKPLILIVDDEESVLEILGIRLESAGYDVVKARNGNEAIMYAIKDKPDMIIMDIMMPEIDGFQATEILKSKLETATIPIMILTAKSDVESELHGINLGADDYMGKPFDGERLLARVKMLLRRKQ